MPRDSHQCQCEICRTESNAVVMRQHREMNLLLSRLNEQQRRWYVGSFSQQPEGPSDEALSQITGLDEKTIRRGRRELANGLEDAPVGRLRQEGAGRPRAEKKSRSWK
jgi:hypothetical protein